MSRISFKVSKKPPHHLSNVIVRESSCCYRAGKQFGFAGGMIVGIVMGVYLNVSSDEVFKTLDRAGEIVSVAVND